MNRCLCGFKHRLLSPLGVVKFALKLTVIQPVQNGKSRKAVGVIVQSSFLAMSLSTLNKGGSVVLKVSRRYDKWCRLLRDTKFDDTGYSARSKLAVDGAHLSFVRDSPMFTSTRRLTNPQDD